MESKPRVRPRSISRIFAETLNKCAGRLEMRSCMHERQLIARLAALGLHPPFNHPAFSEATVLMHGFMPENMMFAPMDMSSKKAIMDRLLRIRSCLYEWEDDDIDMLLDTIDRIDDKSESGFREELRTGFSCRMPRGYPDFRASWRPVLSFLIHLQPENTEEKRARHRQGAHPK